MTFGMSTCVCVCVCDDDDDDDDDDDEMMMVCVCDFEPLVICMFIAEALDIVYS
jgi:hypothetical protein